ncbi:MAG: anti-sigma factor family protein [Longimicrobiaceae bacterium]
MSTTTNIDCQEALRSLFAYLDGELEGARRRDVEAHLERCRSCFSRAEFEQHLKEHLAELGSAPVEPAFESRIGSLISRFDCLE